MRKRGFTLIEVIISAVILALTIAGILASSIAVRRYNLRSRLRLTAANYGRELLDELKNEKWDSGRLQVTSGWQEASITGNGFITKYNIQRWYRVDDVTGSPQCVDDDCRYRKVTVEVKWSVPK